MMLISLLPTALAANYSEFDPSWPVEFSYHINGLDYYFENSEVQKHEGIDICAQSGHVNEPVYAVCDGKVVNCSNKDSDSRGCFVLIRHTIGSNFYYSRYLHLVSGSVSVQEGDTVLRGQQIGKMGNTGQSDGTHLHLELWKASGDRDESNFRDVSKGGVDVEIRGRSFDYYLHGSKAPRSLKIWYNSSGGIQNSVYYDFFKTFSGGSNYYLVTLCPHDKINCGVCPDCGYTHDLNATKDTSIAGKYKVTADMNMKEKPYANDGYNISKTVKAVKVGDIINAQYGVQNYYGSTWYYGTTSDGYSGYVNAKSLTPVDQTKPTLSITGETKPSQLDVGKIFNLYGTISTNVGTVTSVTGKILSSSGSVLQEYTVYPNAKSYDINTKVGTAASINTKMSFGSLSTGNYVYSLSATAKNGSQTTTKELIRANFTVGNATPVHTHSYQRGYEATHPHHVYMKCSCGDWYYIDEYETVSTCHDCIYPSKPVLTSTYPSYYEGQTVRFNWNATTNTTHYNFWLYKKDASGNYVSYSNTFYAQSGHSYSNLSVGEYRAVVQSVNSNAWLDTPVGGSNWPYSESEYVYFTVVSPFPSKVNLQCDGSFAEDDPITFSWNKASLASDYTIILYYKGTKGEYIEFKREDYASSGVQYKFSPGDYRAVILSVNRNYWLNEPVEMSNYPFTRSNYLDFSIRHHIAFDANGSQLEQASQSYQIDGFNCERGSGMLIVYNQSGQTVGTNVYGREIAVDSSGQVIDFRDYDVQEKLAVPDKGVVVSAHVDGLTGANRFVMNSMDGYVGIDYTTNCVYHYITENGYLAHHKTVADGEKYGKLPVPIREGYTFDGWYTAKEGGEKITAKSAYSTSTLYAHWKKNITFDANGGTLPSAKDSFVVDGYNLARGMGQLVIVNDSGREVYYNEYGCVSLVNSDGSVKEKFLFKEVTVTVPDGGFVLAGHQHSDASSFAGASADDYIGIDYSTNTVYRYYTENAYLCYHKSVASNSVYGKLPVLTRDGYTFEGWYTAKDGGVKVTEESIYSVSTLYAHWLEDDRIAFAEKPVLSNGKVSVQIAKAITEPTEIIFAVACYDISGKMIGVTMVTQTVNGNTASVILDYPQGMSSESVASWKVLLLDAESFSPMCQYASGK